MEKQMSEQLNFNTKRISDVSVADNIIRWIMNFFSEGPIMLPQRVILENGQTGYSYDTIINFFDRDNKGNTIDGRNEEKFNEIISVLEKDNTDQAKNSIAVWKPVHDSGLYLKRCLHPFTQISGKKLLIMVGAGTVLITGAIIGNAFPDFDISWFGIGSHRNFVTHSAIPLWGLYKFHKWAVYKIQPEPDTLIDLSLKAMGLLIAGFALGASTHLLIDATFQGSKAVIFPLLGSLIGGTLLDDNMYLSGNSFISLYVAFREFQYILGNDHVLVAGATPYIEKALKFKDEVQRWIERLIKFLMETFSTTKTFFDITFDEKK